MMRRSLILDVGAQMLFHSVLLVSLFLLFAGHNEPGGGFIGGLVAAAGFGLRYLAGGRDEVRAVTRLHPWAFLGTGLFTSAATAGASIVLGGQILESGKWEPDLPVLGHVPVSSALAFDVGVYLVVVGLMLMAVSALGADLTDEEQEVDAA